jgi:hypothetical protein
MRSLKIYLVLTATLILGCDSNLDKHIKEGYFDQCTAGTVQELIESFVAEPKWESIMGDDNKYHLNVTGGITYSGNPAEILIQFEVLENNRWQINAVEVNKIPKDEYFVSDLINSMCTNFTSNQTGNESTNYNDTSNTSDRTVSQSEVKQRLDEYIRQNSVMHGTLGLDLYYSDTNTGAFVYSGSVCYGMDEYSCEYMSANFSTTDFGETWSVEF